MENKLEPIYLALKLSGLSSDGLVDCKKTYSCGQNTVTYILVFNVMFDEVVERTVSINHLDLVQGKACIKVES